jgi:hypothetical protein
MTATATEHRLCYVDPPWAYFAACPPTEVWGDDWDDAPYQHNAGTPSCPCVVLAYRGGDLGAPGDRGRGAAEFLSVEEINRGLAPWLATDRYHEGEPVVIPAGVTVAEFHRLVELAGGEVYARQSTGGAP